MFTIFKNLLTTSIITSVGFLLLGLAFIAFPVGSMAIISNLIAVFLIVYGIYGLVLCLQSISVSYSLNIGTSIIALVLGIVIFSHNAILEAIIPVILGVFFLINGITKLRYAVVLKEQGKHWYGPVAIACVLLVCGIVMLAHPVFTAAALTTFLGVVMIIYAICDLVDAAFLRRDLAVLEKHFKRGGSKKNYADNVKEAEVIDKKRKK